MPELIPDIMTHYELPWRLAFGAPYKGGVISYIGSGRQSTPLHFDDLENLVTFYLLSTDHYNPLKPSLRLGSEHQPIRAYNSEPNVVDCWYETLTKRANHDSWAAAVGSGDTGKQGAASVPSQPVRVPLPSASAPGHPLQPSPSRCTACPLPCSTQS